jgi:propionyl-CoA carboxylase alpha chain
VFARQLDVTITMHKSRSLLSKKYFKKVLIANRGEIACRVIKTCKRLQIPTVAVYSTADSKSKHVKMADEAVCVGPPQTSESYLRIEKILDAVKKTGADAVHPGYGFLSENMTFSKALADNGITFIGPEASAIQAMGDKIESKKLAKSLGVSVIPGYNGEIEDEKHLLKVANEVGYPVMMKASAGGGGKGMRVAYNDAEALGGFKLSKTEAKASFGDDRMLVEKFIDEPRHIEIQVLGDKLGNVLYLPERECSIQRRNQKVIEEAPSTFIDPATRKAMGEQAAMLARGVKYHTAGTVEMMVDGKRNFYFLEMNTRLQVEHPITELITGIDLVEEMLRAAAGLPLSITQEQVKINGWATECRVYAEDPLNNFLPVIGRLNRYEEPLHVEGVRVDSGILEGSEISVFYDPLISKLCTWGPTRQESLHQMALALDSYVIRGLARTNINFLRDLMTHPRYVSGKITTKFIEQEFPQGYKGHIVTEAEEMELMSVAAVIHTLKNLVYYGRKLNHPTQDSKALCKRWVVRHGDVAYYLDIRSKAAEGYLSLEQYLSNEVFQKFELSLVAIPLPAKGRNFTPLTVEVPFETDLLAALSESNTGNCTPFVHHHKVDSQPLENAKKVTMTTIWELNTPIIRYTFKGENIDKDNCVQLLSSDTFHYRMQYMGSTYTLSVLSPLEYAMTEHMLPPPTVDHSKEIRSPMPGVVVEALVKKGDRVNSGQAVVILEAMKMRNVLYAQAGGKVKEVCVPVGESVDDGATLIILE